MPDSKSRALIMAAQAEASRLNGEARRESAARAAPIQGAPVGRNSDTGGLLFATQGGGQVEVTPLGGGVVDGRSPLLRAPGSQDIYALAPQTPQAGDLGRELSQVRAEAARLAGFQVRDREPEWASGSGDVGRTLGDGWFFSGSAWVWTGPGDGWVAIAGGGSAPITYSFVSPYHDFIGGGDWADIPIGGAGEIWIQALPESGNAVWIFADNPGDDSYYWQRERITFTGGSPPDTTFPKAPLIDGDSYIGWDGFDGMGDNVGHWVFRDGWWYPIGCCDDMPAPSQGPGQPYTRPY